MKNFVIVFIKTQPAPSSRVASPSKSELLFIYWSLEQQQPKLLQSLMRHRKINNWFLWIWEYNLALCIDSSDSNWYAHR